MASPLTCRESLCNVLYLLVLPQSQIHSGLCSSVLSFAGSLDCNSSAPPPPWLTACHGHTFCISVPLISHTRRKRSWCVTVTCRPQTRLSVSWYLDSLNRGRHLSHVKHNDNCCLVFFFLCPYKENNQWLVIVTSWSQCPCVFSACFVNLNLHI